MEDIHRSKQPCCACGSPDVRPLILLEKKGNPPAPGHGLVYLHLLVVVCLVCGSGQVEWYDHDCYPMDEPWDLYTWYALDAADTSKLGRLVGTCLTPLRAECTCPIHAALRASCRTLPRVPWPEVIHHSVPALI